MNELLPPLLDRASRHTNADVPQPFWQPDPGVRIDLHCHSSFSRETLRGLPGLSYRPLCRPEEVYDLAKSRGMDFVTITDHNTTAGGLDLLERRGPLPDFIIGEEVSARFPQDGTGVHINVFDHDEAQHREIQRRRGNIYELVAYLREIDKLFVLNHMTWTSEHRVLAAWQLAALLELFDVFEGLNGSRSYPHNAFTWHATHGRGKVLVAGSDSHAHRVGTTYTVSAGRTKTELLANIRAGQAACCGAFGTPEKLREDVRMVLQRDIERRLAEETSRWRRLACRAANGVGKALYPVVCLGYHVQQALLMRGFAESLPA
jgi:predicted metal-dependent phosphoesterase TrpH